jgi:cyclophilin family peptidyl-prolyl cis-trans isomerase
MYNKLLLLLSIYILSIPISAQYTSSDHDLILSTFKREFNKEIIRSYLNSGDTKKINAALLSISQSTDTGFIKDIIPLPFPKSAEYICFALGQLGPSSNSSVYLLERLKSNPKLSEYILPAIGKTGDKGIFQWVINYGKHNHNLSGISLSLYNFATRFNEKKGEVNSFLIKNLKENNDFSAAFALYRLGPDSSDKEHYIYCLKQALRKNDNSSIPYLLGCIRKLKYFPNDPALFKGILNIKQYDTRIEAVKSLAFSNFNKERLDQYLKYFDDSNPNITRQAAISLKDIKLNNDLKTYLSRVIEYKIFTTHLSPNTKGELFITLAGFTSVNFDSLRNKFLPVVKIDYILKAPTQNKSSAYFHWMVDIYRSMSLNIKMAILDELPSLPFEFRDTTYYKIFLNALVSKEPPLILAALGGLDTAFITGHKRIIRNIINSQVDRLKNESIFSESLYGYYNKSKIVDSLYSDYVLKSLLESDNPSVLLYLYRQEPHLAIFPDSLTNRIVHNPYFDSLFSNFYSYSFQDTTALINTAKGRFRIRLRQDIAPISVGNFCKLASKGYFNNNPFHRVVPGFVIQGGDPTGTGWSGPGYEIGSEFSPDKYKTGTVGMASSGKDTEGSQWFITTGNYPHLDGRYSVFGKVIEGQDVVDSIDQDDVIINIELNK